jgi:hypothetical protein
MEVEFELTEDDLLAFHRCLRAAVHRRAREEQRRNPATKWVAVGIGVAVGCLVVFADSYWAILRDLGLVLLGAVLTLVWLINLGRPSKVIRKLMQEGRNVRHLQRRKVTTTPEGIGVVRPEMTVHYAWSGIDWIEATPDHAFFFISTRDAITVPRSAFATGEEFQAFVEQARRWHEAASLNQVAGFRPAPASEQIEKE